jgi:hypothetical protein
VARAADDNDRGPLIALVAYQQEVVFGYEVTLAQAPLEPAERTTLEHFRRDAQQAATALRKALEAEGAKPSAPPDPKTAPPATDPTLRGYLHDVIVAEQAAVASFYTALQGLTDTRHVNGSAAFMAQAGRRLVVLRHLAGDPLLPRTFETGGA